MLSCLRHHKYFIWSLHNGYYKKLSDVLIKRTHAMSYVKRCLRSTILSRESSFVKGVVINKLNQSLHQRLARVYSVRYKYKFIVVQQETVSLYVL